MPMHQPQPDLKSGYDREIQGAGLGPVLRIIALLTLIAAGIYGLDRLILFVRMPQSGIYGVFNAQGYEIRSLDAVNATGSLQRGACVTAVEDVPITDMVASFPRIAPGKMPRWKIDQPVKLTVVDDVAGIGAVLLQLRPFELKYLAGPFRIWFLGAFILLCGSYLLYRYPRVLRVNILALLLFASALSIFNYSGRHLALDLNPRMPLILGIRIATASIVFSSWLHLVLLFLRKRGRFHPPPVAIVIIYLAPLLIAFFGLLLHANPLAGYERVMRLLYLWGGGAVILSFIILMHAFRTAKDAVLRAQLKWVLLGHIFGMSPYILLYALPTAFSGAPLISYGLGLAPFPIIVFAYLFAFYRYRLMDVDEVIHGSVVYAVSAGILIVFYLVIVGLFHRVLMVSAGGRFAAGSDLLFILGLAFVFNPLKNLVRKEIDRVLFPERNELPGILLEGSATIARASHMSEILGFLLSELPARFAIESAAVALKPPQGEEWEVRMNPEGWIEWSPAIKTALESSVKQPLSFQEWGMEKGIFNAFPLQSGNDLWGFYLLGKRSTNRLLNSNEAGLISTLSTQAAHRVGNARLLETLQRANRSLADFSSRLMQTEQMANLGEGAAMLAHEIKTPLGIIRGSAEILERAKDPAKNGEVIRFITEEADRLAAIVDEFIQFARTPPPSKTETDLNDLLQSAALLWESRRKGKGDISLQIRLGPRAGKVALDSKQIYQVLLNLFANAEEAMPRGGALTVASDVDNQTGHVRISVRDSGMGIPEQDLVRVFDRFFTTKESGLGLGLALVKKIMEGHGGAVRITSSPGKGTEVELILPRGGDAVL